MADVCRAVTRERLIIKNSCGDSIWMQQTNDTSFQLPGEPVIQKIVSGGSYSYNLPDAGAPSFMILPKVLCDDSGNNCKIGQVYEPCPTEHCQVNFQSKLEATFGCVASDQSTCRDNPSNPSIKLGTEDNFDLSAVDGYSLPYKLEISGTGYHQCDPGQTTSLNQKGIIDGSSLSVRSCPSDENGINGFPNADLQVTTTDLWIGCVSPCQYLTTATNANPPGKGFDPASSQAAYYCCVGAAHDPATCLGGPPGCSAKSINNTDYVTEIHSTAPDIYAWQYDEQTSSPDHGCPAGTIYTLTFCPNGGKPWERSSKTP